MMDDRDLEKRLEQLGRDVTPESSLKRGVLTRLADLPAPAEHSLTIWRIIMKSPLMKTCAAAVLVLAVVTVYHLGGHGTNVAWGSVVEKLELIETFKYRERKIETSGARREGFLFVSENETTVWATKQKGRHSESYRAGELAVSTIVNLPRRTRTVLFHGSKRYDVTGLQSTQYYERDDPHRTVIHCMNAAETLKGLGTKVIDDIVCEGIEISDPEVFYWAPNKPEEFAMRIWVAVDTELPVWVEKEYRMPGRTTRTLQIMDQFEWNVELRSGLFEPRIPPGFTLMEPDSEPDKDFRISRISDVPDPVVYPEVDAVSLLGVERADPETFVPLTDTQEIAKIQDRIVDAWPDYERVRDQLALELSEKLDVETLSLEQTVAMAVALRERFWREGGCLSETSYPYVYASRLLLERLHQQVPDNLAVSDELVETVHSTEFIYSYDPATGKTYRHQAVLDHLAELRLPQFELIQQELAAGRAVAWEDFVRVNDIAFLHAKADEYELAAARAQWLIDHAEAGGWTAFLEQLTEMHEALSRNMRSSVSPYENMNTRYPEESRYCRRLTSFRGPASRGAVRRYPIRGRSVRRSIN